MYKCSLYRVALISIKLEFGQYSILLMHQTAAITGHVWQKLASKVGGRFESRHSRHRDKSQSLN